MGTHYTIVALTLLAATQGIGQPAVHPVEKMILDGSASAPQEVRSDSQAAPEATQKKPDSAVQATVSAPSSATNSSPAERGSNKALGALSMLAGTVMVPFGGLVLISNSWEKCEEDDGGMGLSGGFGPCSESGPNKGGQALGFGISFTGVFLFLNGLVRVFN